MLTCIDVWLIFDSVPLGFVQLRKYSPNSRCRPPSCLRAVFAVFFAIITPGSSCSFYSRRFYFHNQTQPRSHGALTCKNAVFLTSFPR